MLKLNWTHLNWSENFRKLFNFLLRTLLAVSFFVLSACGNGSFTTVSSTTEPVVTDINITPTNPKVIEKSRTVLGYLATSDLQLKLDKLNNIYVLTGHFTILDKDNQTLSEQDFSLSGTINHERASNLHPQNQAEQTLARLTCLDKAEDGFCENAIVDFYVRQSGQTLATQVLINLSQPEQQAAKKAEADRLALQDNTHAEDHETQSEAEDDVDPTEEEGLFVGTLHEDPTPFFNGNTTITVSPSPTPVQEVKPPAKPAKKKEPFGPYIPVGTLIKPSTPNTKAPTKREQFGPYIPVGTVIKPSTSVVMPDEQNSFKALPEVGPVPQARPGRENSLPSLHSLLPEEINDVTRLRDQAIGLAYNGRLEKPTNLKQLVDRDGLSMISFLNPERERFFGTYELVQDIIRIAKYLSQITSGDILTLGDLSRATGGRIASSHKSHQNGLDVDVAYPRTDTQRSNFNSLVNGNSVSSALRIPETFQIFEFTQVSLRALDRIFVDKKIKTALCSFAKHNNLLGSPERGESTAEVLRRLRPTGGHDNHFHLRIKCSTEQPRCRMMREPPAGTGC